MESDRAYARWLADDLAGRNDLGYWISNGLRDRKMCARLALEELGIDPDDPQRELAVTVKSRWDWNLDDPVDAAAFWQQEYDEASAALLRRSRRPMTQKYAESLL